MKIKKIAISSLPGAEPLAFIDTLQYKGVYLDDTAPNTEIHTATWNNINDIPVFARVRDAYTYEFIAKNDVYAAIEKSQYAGSIIITLDNDVEHNAFITEINVKNTDNTFFKKITISYYDKDSLRFVNHFNFEEFPSLLKTTPTELKLKNVSSADGVTPKSIDSDWDSIVNVSGEYIQHSNLYPIRKKDSVESKTDNETGTERTNSINYNKIVAFRGYYNEATAINLYRYLQIANRTTITYGTNIYNIRQTEATLDEIGKDCWMIEFEAVYINNTFDLW